MKILYLVHQFYPERGTGTEKFVLQLAQHCQLAGHEVKVITYDSARLSTPAPASATLSKVTPKPSFKRTLKIHLQRVGIEPMQLRNELAARLPNRILSREYLYQGVPVVAFAHQQRLIRPGSPVHSRQLSNFARELLQREQPDLLHVGHMMRGSEFVQMAAELQIPYLVTLTDFWVICPNSKLLTEGQQICHGPRHGQACQRSCPSESQKRIPRRLAQMQQVLEQAAAVVTPSHFLANTLRAEFGELPLTVIPYGMDMAHLQPNRRSYPTQEPFIFLFAGTLYPPKGIHLLLSAFGKLSDPNVRLEIYGAGPLEEMVRQQAAIDSRISFRGRYSTEQLSSILQQVDVVVVPSVWHENLPLIMQEAQAAGVPTLVSDVGGMTECVTDGVNGFTFRVGDVVDLQRKMQGIIDQPEMLNEIKENIRNPKPGQYKVTSLEEETKAYLQEYQKIVDHKQPQQENDKHHTDSSLLLSGYQVIFAIPSGMISGVDIFTTHLVRQLIERGIQAKIICTKQPSNHPTASCLAADLPIEQLPLPPGYVSWQTRWQAMIDYLEAQAPCIYIPNYDYDYSAVTPKLSERIKVVGVVHSDSSEHYEHMLRLGHTWNATVGVSKGVSRQIETLHPTLMPRLHTIPYGVAVSPTLTEQSTDPTAPLRIIYCGRLVEEQKRVLDLIHIAKRLEELHIPFTLSIIGDGPAKAKMQELCSTFAVQEKLHFTGKLPNHMVIQHLRQSDVFLLTSAYEGLPVSLLEAMANGVVPLVSDIRSGIPELICQGENGLLAAIGDIEGFANQVAYLYMNPTKRRQMANAAQATICREGYRLEDMVDRYLALFQTIIGQPFTRPYGDILPPDRLKHHRSWLTLARHRAVPEAKRTAKQIKCMLADLIGPSLPKSRA